LIQILALLKAIELFGLLQQRLCLPQSIYDLIHSHLSLLIFELILERRIAEIALVDVVCFVEIKVLQQILIDARRQVVLRELL